MKKFLIVLLVLGMNSCKTGNQKDANDNQNQETNEQIKIDSSDCKNWVISDTDKYTGQTMIAGSETIITDNDIEGIKITPFDDKERKNVFILIKVFGNDNCLEKNTEVNFLFQNGEKINLESDNDFNCEGKFTIFFGKYQENILNTFLNQKIKSMRVKAQKKHFDYNLNEGAANQFLLTVNCMNDKIRHGN